jgi:hypothetical protein
MGEERALLPLAVALPHRGEQELALDGEARDLKVL